MRHIIDKIIFYDGQFFTIMAGSKDISEEERKNNIDKAEEQFNLALEFTPKEERMDILFKIGSKYFDEHLFEYANRYFEQINKEFPQNAHSTYFFLIYELQPFTTSMSHTV